MRGTGFASIVWRRRRPFSDKARSDGLAAQLDEVRGADPRDQYKMWSARLSTKSGMGQEHEWAMGAQHGSLAPNVKLITLTGKSRQPAPESRGCGPYPSSDDKVGGKATLIYRRTGNLRAVQLLLGHTKIESTVRYLGIEVDNALAIAEQVDV
jgi:hypothetical protein